MRRSRGLSLIELLMSLAIIVIAMGAVGRAFALGLLYESKSSHTRIDQATAIQFEDRISSLVRGVTLQGANGALVSPAPDAPNSAGQAPPPDSGATSLGSGSATIVFTTLSDPPSALYIGQKGQSFEDLNHTYGPQGGETEVELSCVPVGDAGQKQGLFLREQRPADTDLSQGGFESLLTDRVRDIRFEFYDGSAWQTAWDTRSGQKNQLPTAIRITYIVPGDDQPHSLIVRVPTNPSTTSSSSTPPPGGPGAPGSPGAPTPNPLAPGGAAGQPQPVGGTP